MIDLKDFINNTTNIQTNYDNLKKEQSSLNAQIKDLQDKITEKNEQAVDFINKTKEEHNPFRIDKNNKQKEQFDKELSSLNDDLQALLEAQNKLQENEKDLLTNYRNMSKDVLSNEVQPELDRLTEQAYNKSNRMEEINKQLDDLNKQLDEKNEQKTRWEQNGLTKKDTLFARLVDVQIPNIANQISQLNDELEYLQSNSAEIQFDSLLHLKNQLDSDHIDLNSTQDVILSMKSYDPNLMSDKEAQEKATQERQAKIKAQIKDDIKRAKEHKAKKEAEEQARKEAEEKAKKEAEEKAKKEAEEQARKEAEEKTKKEAEEQARKEAEKKAQINNNPNIPNFLKSTPPSFESPNEDVVSNDAELNEAIANMNNLDNKINDLYSNMKPFFRSEPESEPEPEPESELESEIEPENETENDAENENENENNNINNPPKKPGFFRKFVTGITLSVIGLLSVLFGKKLIDAPKTPIPQGQESEIDNSNIDIDESAIETLNINKAKSEQEKATKDAVETVDNNTALDFYEKADTYNKLAESESDPAKKQEYIKKAEEAKKLAEENEKIENHTSNESETDSVLAKDVAEGSQNLIDEYNNQLDKYEQDMKNAEKNATTSYKNYKKNAKAQEYYRRKSR